MSYKFIDISDCHEITRQTDCDFIFLFQRAVLLSLKEAGLLNEMQHRQAETELLRQYREAIKADTELSSDD